MFLVCTIVLVDGLVLGYRDSHVHSIGGCRLGDDRIRRRRLQVLPNNRLGNRRRAKDKSVALGKHGDDGIKRNGRFNESLRLQEYENQGDSSSSALTMDQLLVLRCSGIPAGLFVSSLRSLRRLRRGLRRLALEGDGSRQ